MCVGGGGGLGLGPSLYTSTEFIVRVLEKAEWPGNGCDKTRQVRIGIFKLTSNNNKNPGGGGNPPKHIIILCIHILCVHV